MSAGKSPSEYFVLSRGRWDEDKSPEQIQAAIDAFYEWRRQKVSSCALSGCTNSTPAR